MTNQIVNEKLDQAAALLQEQGLDLWITYVQETTLTPDPCMDLIAGLDMTWHSAFIVSRGGERIAVVGRYDAENVRAIGGYTQILEYDQGIRPGLLETVQQLDPQTIALNFSEGDAAASGLSH